jgi:hypothetical protein
MPPHVQFWLKKQQRFERGGPKWNLVQKQVPPPFPNSPLLLYRGT